MNYCSLSCYHRDSKNKNKICNESKRQEIEKKLYLSAIQAIIRTNSTTSHQRHHICLCLSKVGRVSDTWRRDLSKLRNYSFERSRNLRKIQTLNKLHVDFAGNLGWCLGGGLKKWALANYRGAKAWLWFIYHILLQHEDTGVLLSIFEIYIYRMVIQWFIVNIAIWSSFLISGTELPNLWDFLSEESDKDVFVRLLTSLARVGPLWVRAGCQWSQPCD